MDLTINERVVLKELGEQEATANEIAVRTGLKVGCRYAGVRHARG